MNSTEPTKSQPLHNFNLSHLKWSSSGGGDGEDNSKEGGQSTSPHHHQRRRSVKSPSRRANAPRSPIRHSPLRDAATAARPLHVMEDPLGRSSNGAEIEYQRGQLKNSTADGAGEGVLRGSEVSGVKRSRYSTVDGADDGIQVKNLKNPSVNSFVKGTAGADVEGGKRSRSLTVHGVKDHIPKKSGMNLETMGKVQGPGLSGMTGVMKSRSLTVDGAKSGFRLSDTRLKETVETDGATAMVKKPRSSSTDVGKNGGFTMDFEGKCNVAMDADEAMARNSKLLIKLPLKTSGKGENDDKKQVKAKHNDEKDDGSNSKDDETGGGTNNSVNDLDEETKTWNLRPRKPLHKSLNVHGVKSTTAKSAISDQQTNHSNKVARSPLRNLNHKSVEAEGGGGEKKVNKKLTIDLALSKDEIEEDIFVMTGSKPSRRPKKRAKNVQKYTDYVFPGTWLVGISADSYKVSEPLIKG